MSDYSSSVLDLHYWSKCYADAMRAKKWGVAEAAAVKIVRIGVDLIDHAEAIAAQRSVPLGKQSVG